MNGASHIYFVAQIGGGLIKIGLAKAPERRIRNLQCGSPVRLELLAFAPGTASDERKLHRIFICSSAHGEWFEPTADILALIHRVKHDGELPMEMRATEYESPVLWKHSLGVRRSPETRRRIGQGVKAAYERLQVALAAQAERHRARA